MKRSKAVTLALMGAATLGMPGCDRGAESYPSVDACIAAGEHSETECRDGFAAAKQEHERTARHFTSWEDCFAAYGADGCEERPVATGGSYFMPLMVGYMFGRTLGYHPLYRDRDRRDGYLSSTGIGFSGYSGGGGWFSRGFSSFAEKVGTVARGGFGGIGEGLSGGS